MLQTISNSSARTELVVDQTHMELRDMSRTMDQSNSETMVISSNVQQMLQDIHGLRQALDPQKLIPELASLMQRGGFRSLGENRNGTTLSQSVDQGATYTNVPSGSNALACGRKRVRKRQISRTVHKLLFLDIEVITFEPLDAMNSIQGGHCITPAIRTETHIRLKFPLSQRTTSLRILREALNPYVTRTLTTYNTVSSSSPLSQAVKSLDLCEMRRLFVNGLASPRDRIKYGGAQSEEVTLLDQILKYDSFPRTPGPGTSQKGLDMLEYLLQVAPPRSEKSTWVKSLFNPELHEYYRQGDRIAAKLRLLDQYCPAQFWENIEPQFCFDKEVNNDDPIYTFIQARNGHIFDLNNRLMEDVDGTIYFAENTRQILEDAGGSGLLLALGQNYPYWPLVGRFGYRLRWGHVIAQLLDLCAESCQDDLIQCCRTRITILINHGHYTNYLHDETRNWFVDMLPFTLHPMEFALHSGTFYVLHDALLDAGWTENMIQASLDDAIYAGIPELFGGIQYMSRDECREEFIQGLCRGDYLDFMKDPKRGVASAKLALSLGMQHVYESKDMIREANASYSQRFIPGSWPVEADQQLIPGIDFHFRIYFPADILPPSPTVSMIEWPCVQDILHQHGLCADDVLVYDFLG
jgi:hypothetical protein